MKTWFCCLAVMAMTAAGFAQFGKYEKENPEFTEIFELFENGRFQYAHKSAWGQSLTSGAWENGEQGQILLTSDIRYSDYTVKESKHEGPDKQIKVVVGGSQKGKAPKTIRRIYVYTEKDTVYCPANSQDQVEEMNLRYELQQRGKPAEQDSMRNSDPRRHYQCEAPRLPLRAIEIQTDAYTIRIEPQDPQANRFEVTTAWAENPMYAYFEQEPFTLEKKQLKSVKRNEYYKPAKK